MTIPELPEHKRFEIIAGEPCFKTASAGWQEIKFLRDAKDVSFVSPEFESCVAIARCWWSDEAHRRHCSYPEEEQKYCEELGSAFDDELEALRNCNNWKLYGESRK